MQQLLDLIKVLKLVDRRIIPHSDFVRPHEAAVAVRAREEPDPLRASNRPRPEAAACVRQRRVTRRRLRLRGRAGVLERLGSAPCAMPAAARPRLDASVVLADGFVVVHPNPPPERQPCLALPHPPAGEREGAGAVRQECVSEGCVLEGAANLQRKRAKGATCEGGRRIESALDLPALAPRLHLAALPRRHALRLLRHEVRVRGWLLRRHVLLLRVGEGESDG